MKFMGALNGDILSSFLYEHESEYFCYSTSVFLLVYGVLPCILPIQSSGFPTSDITSCSTCH